MTPNVSITDEAREHLTTELSGRILRIAFTTGCGGSGYRLASADGPDREDVVLNVDDITIAFDSMAASQLDGAVIRWSEEEDGYLLDHPTAVTSAWCG